MRKSLSIFLLSLLSVQTSAFSPSSPKSWGQLRRTCDGNSAVVEPRLYAAEPKALPEIPFVTKSVASDRSSDLMIGEDAGTFNIGTEEWGNLGERGWFTFSVAVGTIVSAVIVLWVYHPTGYSDDFINTLENIAGGNPHIVTLIFGILFPIVHSGLASLRPLGEKNRWSSHI